MNWYFEVFRKYADFSGRPMRQEYWYFVLFNCLVVFVLTFIDFFAGLANREGLGPLRGIYTLAISSPSCPGWFS